MIDAIQQFDEDRNESVNMRVGIHTGTVSCGIVGKTRFKFDVWSNDVTFANKMESSGKPGKVHISEQTYSFLGNDYLVDEGEMLNGKSVSLFCLQICLHFVVFFKHGLIFIPGYFSIIIRIMLFEFPSQLSQSLF